MNAFARVLMMVGGAALLVAANPGQSIAATLLRMNHQMTANTAGSIVDQWFADEVKKRTNGAVEMKIFFSNGLGEVKETLSLLESGAIDVAALSPGYFPDQLPFFTAPNSIPMAIDNIDQAYVISKRFMAEVPAFMDEARAKKIRPIFFHVLNPYLMVAKEPVLSVEQLKGKKFRTWGSDLPRMAQAIGMTPVTLGVTELYEGLMRGVVDVIPFSVDLMQNYKIYEVAKNVVEVTIWDGPTWGVWISDKAWEKLTPEQQKIVMEVGEEAAKRDLEAVRKAAAESRVFLATQGIKFHPFPAPELVKWRAALPNYFDEFIAKQEARGKGADARKMVEIWKQVVASPKT
jgi:TRAP-type C4-dicarboxylate transport system substrate-binding protein